MNENELIGKIHSSMYYQLQSRGYAAPVDVLIDTGNLPKQKYEDWRFGRVRYLEAVCKANHPAPPQKISVAALFCILEVIVFIFIPIT